jgi:hypothetical protein
MKLKQVLLPVFLLLFSSALFAQSDLEKQLFELPDVIFKKIKTGNGYESSYLLKVKQPIDHSNPEKGHFYQRVWLNNQGPEQPTVIVTSGYDAASNRLYELSNLLNANQIRVEHRFFAESTPEPKEWEYLNMEQATADLHHVRQLFDNIYTGKWVSTGISKGGMTTIYYRYFYPEDVDVSVPYVAPLDTALEDTRIYDFLNTVGPDDCRDKITAFQTRLLKSREECLPRLKYYEKALNHTFDYLGFETAFEYGVLEYSFSFWQMGYKCENIPDAKAPLDEILDHFISVVGMSFFSDQEIANYASHYYQSATETGYYGYETKDFKKLLKTKPMKFHASFYPKDAKVKYDATLSKKAFEWIQNNGDEFIYIYGGTDTWTSAGIPENDKVDAHWFIMEGRNHGDARIRNMTTEERAKLVNALEKWLEMEIE